MKKWILIMFGCFLLGIAAGQPVVLADSLKYCDGKVITVCNQVTSTYVTRGAEKTTFLNFGDFPSQLFTVIIFEEDLKNFSYSPSEYLNGKKICITGDVILRESGPEIIVESPLQIVINN